MLLTIAVALAADPNPSRLERLTDRLATLEAREQAPARLPRLRARQDALAARLSTLDRPAEELEVYVVTNREGYGAADGGALHHAIATVRVPPAHAPGASDLEVIDVRSIEAEAWQAALGEAAGAEHGLLLFVHGYNNAFHDAVRRGAQLAHDLDLPLIPVVYAWPAAGGTRFAFAKYTFDENAAARSAAPFADALGALLREQRAPITLLAHSMGGRVVSDALVDLQRGTGLPRRLHALVLAAPDVDPSVFQRRYADVAASAADRVAVYCADNDRALLASRKVHGGHGRLGACAEVAALAGRVEVVDHSCRRVDLINHDAIARSPPVLRDLRALLLGVSAEARGLGWAEGRYWLDRR